MLLDGKHIFVVEDNIANAGVMLTSLQINGATTYLERWGTHLIPRLLGMPYLDLILMDLMLPNGVTGYDVFDQIKAESNLAHIPIVVVSASDANIEMQKARDRGFKGYISKPIQYPAFAQMIASILEGNEIWGDDLFS
ncbi:MAG: response regulator [Chloroflexi bacterium]|nr:response regulator [Chloroflexota bacterium]